MAASGLSNRLIPGFHGPDPSRRAAGDTPTNHVRLIGHDNLKQTRGHSITVFRG